MARLMILIQIFWDSIACSFGLAFARLLPRLKVPAVDLTGKTAIVTGANSGIGYEIALKLALQGATVHLACRNVDKGEQACERIRSVESNANVHVLQLDTSDLTSVHNAATEWKRSRAHIVILVHNAGRSTITSTESMTNKDGLGMLFLTNFLGSFVLTNLLEEHLSPTARVIFTSSTGLYAATPSSAERTMRNKAPKRNHQSGTYSDTKLMQVAFTRLLPRRWNQQKNNGKVAHVFTPGYTSTAIFGNMSESTLGSDPLFWLLRSLTILALPVEQGAATGVWLATAQANKVSDPEAGGKFWDRMVSKKTPVDAMGAQRLRSWWGLWETDSHIEWG